MSKDNSISSMIRVDHAGEYGAVRIYEGQLKALSKCGDESYLQIIADMKQQELKHLATFNDIVVARKVRPTILQPLWHVAGYALGYLTGAMGKEAAMACTVAVEEVIESHYESQEKILDQMKDEEELKNVVKRFRQEELEHKDLGIQHGARNASGYALLSTAVKSASRIAIWLSKRV